MASRFVSVAERAATCATRPQVRDGVEPAPFPARQPAHFRPNALARFGETHGVLLS